MNTEQAKALGMLAKTLLGFSWEGRMMNGRTGYTLDPEFDESGDWVSLVDDWPDFRDPPTAGWLLHQVREAWGDPNMWVEFEDNHWAVMASKGERDDVSVSTSSDVTALVRALKAAPNRNAATPREPHTSKGSARCPQ